MEFNPFTLEGKTVLVTGASSGIGRETAVQCSKMGARLLITGRNEERLEETLGMLAPGGDGMEHSMFITDLTDASALESLVSALPALDGMFLSAGDSVVRPLKFADREQMDKVFEINFFAQAELLRLLVRGKKLNYGASVVLMSSVSGSTVFSPGHSIYGASKAALDALMKYAAVELSGKGIRVNCICAGMVETPLIHRGTVSDEQLAADMAEYPLRRYGKPSDIATGVIYLLSGAASWVTGTSLTIDGGISLK